MTDEETLRLLGALQSHETAHAALVAVAIAQRSPRLLGAADALFGCNVRPMLVSQAWDYHDGYVHACATHGIDAEPMSDEPAHDHIEPMVDCDRYYGPVYGPEPLWTRERYVEEQPRKRWAQDQETIDRLTEVVLDAQGHCQYGWYLVGLLTRLFVWPTQRPETEDGQRSFGRGRWALPSDSEQDWLDEETWDEYESKFPTRLVHGPEDEMRPNVRYQ